MLLIYPSSSSPLVIISLFSMSMNLFLFCKQQYLLDSTYKWYHKHLPFSVWLTLLSMKSLGLSMLLQMEKFHSFLWLYSIPLCVMEYTCLYTHIYIHKDPHSHPHPHPHTHTYIQTHHIFFIHSSVDGYLGCFQVLAVVNNAALNIGVHVAFQIRVFDFSRYMPRSRIVGSYVALFLAF